jgi:hypothetical protein
MLVKYCQAFVQAKKDPRKQSTICDSMIKHTADILGISESNPGMGECLFHACNKPQRLRWSEFCQQIATKVVNTGNMRSKHYSVFVHTKVRAELLARAKQEIEERTRAWEHEQHLAMLRQKAADEAAILRGVPRWPGRKAGEAEAGGGSYRNSNTSSDSSVQQISSDPETVKAANIERQHQALPPLSPRTDRIPNGPTEATVFTNTSNSSDSGGGGGGGNGSRSSSSAKSSSLKEGSRFMLGHAPRKSNGDSSGKGTGIEDTAIGSAAPGTEAHMTIHTSTSVVAPPSASLAPAGPTSSPSSSSPAPAPAEHVSQSSSLRSFLVSRVLPPDGLLHNTTLDNLEAMIAGRAHVPFTLK